MSFKELLFVFLLVATSQAGLLLGKDGLLDKVGKTIGIDNLININADARAKILDNEIGIDAGIGIGEHGTGAHASIDGDVLGQKAKISADVLDGNKIYQHNHEVFKDSNNRQYILQREYIGTKSVLVRKYLDEGKIYLDGAEKDNVLQHKYVEEPVLYDQYGGWLDRRTGRYYNRYGQLVSDNYSLPPYVEGQKYGTNLPINPTHQRSRNDWIIKKRNGYGNQPNGGWQEDGTYIAVDPEYMKYTGSVDETNRGNYGDIVRKPLYNDYEYHNQPNGGWQKDGTYIAVDPAYTKYPGSVDATNEGIYRHIVSKPLNNGYKYSNQPNGGWQEDGTYMAVDPEYTKFQKTFDETNQGDLGKIISKPLNDVYQHPSQ